MRNFLLLLMGGGVILTCLTMCSGEKDEAVIADSKLIEMHQFLHENYGGNSTIVNDFQLESRNANCTGFSNNGGCFSVVSYLGSIEINGCPFNVTAFYQVCVIPGLEIRVSIWDMQWQPDMTDPDCNAIFQNIGTLNPQAQQAALDDLHASISKVLEEEITTAVIATFIGVGCGGENSNASASFFEADCRAWCFNPGDLGGSGFDLDYVSCGTNCCKRSSEYCYDFDNGKLVELSSSVGLSGEPCSTPAGLFCLTENENFCTDPCQRLD